MTSFRLAYLAHFGYLGMAILFWPVYLREAVGLEDALVGASFACMVAGSVTGSWAQARAADATGRRRAIQRWASVGTTVLSLGWLLVGAPAEACGLAFLQGLFVGGTIPLLDASLVDHLGVRRRRFGHVRLFGTLGFAGAGFGLSFLWEADPARIPIAMAIASGSYHALTWALPDSQRRSTGERGADGFRAVLANGPLRLVLSVALLHALAFGVFESFQGIHYERYLGLHAAEIGTLFMAAYLPEVVMFLWAPHLIGRFDGSVLLMVATGGSALRWLLMSVAMSAAAILPLQLLHALTFGLWYATSIHLIGGLVPAHQRTRGQALLSMCFGTGMACGALLGGALRQHWGVPQSYLAATALGASALALVAALRKRLGAASPHPAA